MKVMAVVPVGFLAERVAYEALEDFEDVCRLWLGGTHQLTAALVEEFKPDLGIGTIGATFGLTQRFRDAGICEEEHGAVVVPVLMVYNSQRGAADDLARRYLSGEIEEIPGVRIAGVATDVASLREELERLLT